MRADTDHRCEDSFADLVWGLKPGAPCPWCGEALLSGASEPCRGGQVWDAPESDDDVVLLHCPNCGCEVMGYPLLAHTSGQVPLASAA
jgi:hypothetical protein